MNSTTPITKLSGLSHFNTRALREVCGDWTETGNTWATFGELSSEEAAKKIEDAMIPLPARGHPRASLHAVVRRLRRGDAKPFVPRGKGVEPVEKAEPKKATKKATVKVEAEKVSPFGAMKASEVVMEFLRDENSPEEVGTFEMPKAFITTKGLVRIHSRTMLAWATKKYGKKVTKGDVQSVLRELGLQVKPTNLPGIEKAVGTYTGKPKGVSLKGLAVRDLRKAAAK